MKFSRSLQESLQLCRPLWLLLLSLRLHLLPQKLVQHSQTIFHSAQLLLSGQEGDALGKSGRTGGRLEVKTVLSEGEGTGASEVLEEVGGRRGCVVAHFTLLLKGSCDFARVDFAGVDFAGVVLAVEVGVGDKGALLLANLGLYESVLLLFPPLL
jgi:hypothetical protein